MCFYERFLASRSRGAGQTSSWWMGSGWGRIAHSQHPLLIEQRKTACKFNNTSFALPPAFWLPKDALVTLLVVTETPIAWHDTGEFWGETKVTNNPAAPPKNSSSMAFTALCWMRQQLSLASTMRRTVWKHALLETLW